MVAASAQPSRPGARRPRVLYAGVAAGVLRPASLQPRAAGAPGEHARAALRVAVIPDGAARAPRTAARDGRRRGGDDRGVDGRGADLAATSRLQRPVGLRGGVSGQPVQRRRHDGHDLRHVRRAGGVGLGGRRDAHTPHARCDAGPAADAQRGPLPHGAARDGVHRCGGAERRGPTARSRRSAGWRRCGSSRSRWCSSSGRCAGGCLRARRCDASWRCSGRTPARRTSNAPWPPRSGIRRPGRLPGSRGRRLPRRRGARDSDPDDPAVGVSELRDNGDRVAAIVHDPALDGLPGLMDAAGAAALLSLRNAKLSAVLRASVRDLRASRARIASAGDEARRRFESEVATERSASSPTSDDSFEQAARTATTPDLRASLAELASEAEQTLASVHATAQGITPPGWPTKASRRLWVPSSPARRRSSSARRREPPGGPRLRRPPCSSPAWRRCRTRSSTPDRARARRSRWSQQAVASPSR